MNCYLYGLLSIHSWEILKIPNCRLVFKTSTFILDDSTVIPEDSIALMSGMCIKCWSWQQHPHVMSFNKRETNREDRTASKVTTVGIKLEQNLKKPPRGQWFLLFCSICFFCANIQCTCKQKLYKSLNLLFLKNSNIMPKLGT